jgi:hypothetical protein
MCWPLCNVQPIVINRQFIVIHVCNYGSVHCRQSAILHLSWLVLATGPGGTPAVRLFPGGSVQFGPRHCRKPDQLYLGGFVTRTRHRTVGFWPGWNRTAVPNIPFPQLWFQLSIWVLIISRYGHYVNCAVSSARSPPVFRYAIWPVFIESLTNIAKLRSKFVGFQSRLSE